MKIIIQSVLVFITIVIAGISFAGVSTKVPFSEIEEKLNAKFPNELEIGQYGLQTDGVRLSRYSDDFLTITVAADIFGLSEPLNVQVSANTKFLLKDGKLHLDEVIDPDVQITFGNSRQSLLEKLATTQAVSFIQNKLNEFTGDFVVHDLTKKEGFAAKFIKFSKIDKLVDDGVIIKFKLF